MSTSYAPSASAGTFSGGLTAQGTIAALNDAVVMPTLNVGTVGFQLTGTWSGTVSFEGSIDGQNWIAVDADPVPSGAAVTSASANGIFQIPCSGVTQVRARLSAVTSGGVTVTGCTSLAARST